MGRSLACDAGALRVTAGWAPTAGDLGFAFAANAVVVAGLWWRDGVAAFQDPYGTVQVAVTMKGTRIADVQAVAMPLDSGRSRSINTVAAPLLRQEVLRAQSAQVGVISGATYTSEAYAQSLQAALDRAGA